jgi:hypothetical protein
MFNIEAQVWDDEPIKQFLKASIWTNEHDE